MSLGDPRFSATNRLTSALRGQVRLRQTAVGVNFLDIYFRQGDFSPPFFPFVNGFEAAGVVEAVGEGVTDVQPNQRVAYQLVMGSYAEERVMPVDRLVPRPTRAQAAVNFRCSPFDGLEQRKLGTSFCLVEPGRLERT